MLSEIIKIMAWSLGLINSMKDPKLLMIKTDELICIKDGYPKARYHFLVLPLKSINSIFDVSFYELNTEDQCPINKSQSQIT